MALQDEMRDPKEAHGKGRVFWRIFRIGRRNEKLDTDTEADMFCRQVVLAFVLAFLSGCAVTRFLNEATVTLENTRPTLEKLPGLIEAAQIQITDLGETAKRLFESTEQVVGLQSEGLTRIAASVETVLAELSVTSRETTETLRVIREQANRVGDKTIWILASIAGGAGWLTKFSLVEKAKELKRKVIGSKQV